MNMSKTFLFFILLFPAICQAQQDVLHPKTREIQIEKITEDIINVVPGRSVKIIFPWILSEENGFPSHKISLSNDNVFSYEYTPGMNFILVIIQNLDLSIEGEVADLAVSTNGYHFTFLLRANFRPSLHYSSIVLKATEAMRLQMIDDEVRRLRESFEVKRQELEASLDERAKIQAMNIIANLAVERPHKKNIKEDMTFEAKDGNKVGIYIDEALRYGEFTIYKLEINNKRNAGPLLITNMSVSSSIGGAMDTPLQNFDVPRRIESGETVRATISTLNDKFMQSQKSAMVFETNLGPIEVKW